ncbi:transcriptional regulator [Tractidigestivibacter scatoligenes]|jgi:predicted DNA-binding transcriptional regulator YafY|uniref:transcriptional regulator n=1 Tax=Tractidigestivibacter scatoligenes TaxID=1299998 RepID=UPI002F35D285
MASRRQGAGRKGGLQEARELVAIISSLDHAGDSIDVATIAGRLGISEEEARHRMELILSAGGEGAAVLPLSADAGNGRLTLEGGAGNHARRLRLTKSETIAMQAALNQMGIPADAPLRKKLSSSLSPTGVSNAHADYSPDDGGGITDSNKSQVGETILTCSKAISQLGMLDFTYQGIADDAPRRRHVDPRGLRNTNGAWYLDAYDPSRHGERVFRLDRMTGVSVAPAEEVGSEPEESVGTRSIRVTFHDRHYLELLDWPGLRVERDDGSVVYTRIPYYGGDWLPRRIAACAGTAYASDGEVNSLAVAYARKILDEK